MTDIRAMQMVMDDATARERERCARIADHLARSNEILNGGKDAPGAIAAARVIAARIRNEE